MLVSAIQMSLHALREDAAGTNRALGVASLFLLLAECGRPADEMFPWFRRVLAERFTLGRCYPLAQPSLGHQLGAGDSGDPGG